ncbi:MAG: hypothetical protein DMF69_04190 [Acidobacteria bacterium]|nr:MAG: hypothetical protein DMF69_04190 [Acidobacteriota bacterium]
MYCPSCGSEERQLSQYCRACGTDLRIVRNTLERPDSITASAISAREQIGVAVADQLRELKTGKDLKKFAEDALPQLEKFLESPEEKRLRRIRKAVITASVGLGWTIVAFFLALNDADFIPMMIPGVIVFFIGLGILINGLWFTTPRKKLPGDSQDALSQNLLDSSIKYDAPQLRSMTNELTPAVRMPVGSVTEHTTHHLGSKKD